MPNEPTEIEARCETLCQAIMQVVHERGDGLPFPLILGTLRIVELHLFSGSNPMPDLQDKPTLQKPTDAELRKLWGRAVRLARPWRGSLAHRLAYGIADDLEARGVTDDDIDRVEAMPDPQDQPIKQQKATASDIAWIISRSRCPYDRNADTCSSLLRCGWAGSCNLRPNDKDRKAASAIMEVIGG